MLLHIPLTLAMLAVLVTEDRTGITLAQLLRDPVQALHGPAYVGYLSNLGAMCWCAAAAVCLISAAALWNVDRSSSRFLLYSGLINALLGCDDLFMIHDGVLAYRYHIGERRFLACYALLMAGYLWIYWRPILREPALFFIAAGLFASSILADQFWHSRTSMRYFAEDGLKLLGIVTWLVLYVRLSLDAVRAHLMPATGRRSLG
jgi:hypothetical protein